MVKCSFCGNQIPRGTGKIYVEKEGRIFNFCSNKCEKNQLKLRRKARTLKWTKKYVKGTNYEKIEEVVPTKE